MMLPGVQYIGTKEVGRFEVGRYHRNHPEREIFFEKGEIKIVPDEISADAAYYLTSHFKGLIETIEQEIPDNIVFEKMIVQVLETNKWALTPGEMVEIFCQVFGITIEAPEKEPEPEGQAEEPPPEEKTPEEKTEEKAPAKKKAKPKKKAKKKAKKQSLKRPSGKKAKT